MKDFREQDFYELLDLPVHASGDDIQSAYERARRTFSPDSLATYSLFQPDELGLMLRRIDEAYRTLTNPERRRRYDAEQSRLSGDVWSSAPMGEGPAVESEPVQQREPAENAEREPGKEGSRPAERTALVRSPRPPLTGVSHQQLQALSEKIQAELFSAEEARLEEQEQASSKEPMPAEPSLAATGEDGMTGSAMPSGDESTAQPEEPAPPADGESPPIMSIEPSLEQVAVVPGPDSGSSPPSEPPIPEPPIPEAPSELAAFGSPSEPVPHQVAPVEAAPPMPEIDERTEFTGDLLRQIRQARGISLDEIANVTKISIFYLRSIEEERYDQLPAPVYVRGYIQQISRLLHLDSNRVTSSFLSLLKNFH